MACRISRCLWGCRSRRFLRRLVQCFQRLTRHMSRRNATCGASSCASPHHRSSNSIDHGRGGRAGGSLWRRRWGGTQWWRRWGQPVEEEILDRKNASGERLPVDFLSKICTSAVKESLTNIYGDRFDSFTRNFEKSFGSTLRTLHLINETSVHEQRSTPSCSFEHNDSPTEKNLSGAYGPAKEVQRNIFLNSEDNQLVIHGRVNQQLAYISHSRSRPEFDQHILSTFERSLNEQVRSNDLKEFEIGLNVRKLQLKQSQLDISSLSHELEKVKISMGLEKASFKEKIFRTKMQDTRHAELLRMLIDFLVTAVIIMSVCFGYGTYIYSYQRITAVTSACAAASRESKSWWMPNSVSSFNSGLLFLRCHLVALTRMTFGILMILAIAWLIFQRSAMTGPNMPITFNLVLLGILCGFAGRFCVDTLGGDGIFWLLCWEALCSIHLLGNIYPSFIYRVLHGPISMSSGNHVARLPYWVRRYIFYTLLLLVLPTSAGLLPFASLSDWKEHFIEKIKPAFIGSEVEA